MCSLCITTGICQFDVESLSCEAKSAETVANGTATTYCTSNDTVCSMCNATAADPICTGEDGECICQSLCSVIQPLDTSDCSSDGSAVVYIGIAVGMVCIALAVLFAAKCRRRYLRLLRQRSFESQYRRESELLRMRQPQLALTLVGWRDTLEINKPEMHKLGACSYVMNQDEECGSTGAVAAISAGNVEPSTSMETSSTLSEIVQSPVRESVAWLLACMEPLSATGGRVVPKLHLLNAGIDTESRHSNNAVHRGSTSERLPHRPSRRHPESSGQPRVGGKVMPARVSAASMEFLESPVLPPMQLRPMAGAIPSSSSSTRQVPEADSNDGSKTHRNTEAEFHVLHPAIDELADERGEDLARLLLSRWSIHSGEEQFASISLFCEMKLNEAKRMASWAEAPNRFYTVVCCQLLEKYITRLAANKGFHSNAEPAVGQSIAFLQRIHAELVTSIFVPPTQAQIQDHAASWGRVDYEHRTPYFTVTASLSRKDIAIAEAEAKVASMARIIDSLTESNKQLSHQVDQLENLSAAAAFANGGDVSGDNRCNSYGFVENDTSRPRVSDDGTIPHTRRRDVNYERIDTMLSQEDDERMDRTNRMLLETMFGMARMVETCAIQMSKDTMDSLEYQLDGSVLQQLAEMVSTP
ncbi:unnamed protein product [Phytophthora fragariaefolia]|uniref:Unnamed protein product n=1 Tax=Phytophthora fragariaefolia TaxID=1490495 RepID=A0A9W6XQL1_9STRA|nr:unnamed protein product [Phytophthora fragariaefolia]